MPVDTFDTPGSDTWTCPAGVTSIQLEVWGPGGGGADDDGMNGGGGGGGGGYTRWDSISVTPSTVYDLIVGATGTAGTGGGNGGLGGDTYMTIAGDVWGSQGGQGGTAGGAGGPGGADYYSGPSPDAAYAGGGGADASTLLGVGAGGGSSAGTGSHGNNGSMSTGGAAVTGGGAGGDGGTGGGAATAGSQPGGGGGGASTFGAGQTAMAGGDGKIVITYASPPSSDPSTAARKIEESNPWPPFPGQVIFYRNPYGDPPPSFLSGQYTQLKAEMVNPDPPFPGQVTAIRPAMGETPPIIPSPIIPSVIVATSPGMESPFPGAVHSPLATPYGPAMGETPPIIPSVIVATSPGMESPFPGAVHYALATPCGIEPLPSRPVLVEMASPPPPFQGSVAYAQPRVDDVRPPSVPAGIVRESEGIADIRQPISWAGVPPRDASFAQHVVQHPPPPPYMGDVISYRNPYASSQLPQPRQEVVRAFEDVSEPGRVIAFGGRIEETLPVSRPSIVSQTASLEELVQPRAWAGVPPRDAPHNTVTIVSQVASNGFPGHVYAGRSAFGLEPLPSRPLLIQQAEGHATEPGRVLFQRTIEPAPVLPPQSLVIRSDETNRFPGAVRFHRGESDPVVRPITYLIAGATNYPEVVQPFWGYGYRDGSGAPPDPGAGYPVTLYGYDRSVITLTSIEGCQCQ